MTDETMRDLEQSLREVIREEYEEMRQEAYPEDRLHEMADSWVPIYTYDLMQYAANDISLAVDEPGIGPAFDGSPTPVNIIAANIYERLQMVAHEQYRELELEAEEINDRLAYLRNEIENERISYSEILELQDLGERGLIPEGDVVLREWAGIPEEVDA